MEGAVVRLVGWLARDELVPRQEWEVYGLGCAPRGRPLTPLRGCGPVERCAACGHLLYDHEELRD